MPMTVVGRQPELELAAGLLATLGSDPVALVIEGDLGIGKSTLWRAVVELARVRPSVHVLQAAPAEAESRLAYVALADLLDTAIDDVSNALPEPQRHALNVALLREEPAVPLDQRAVGAALVTALRWLASAGPVIVAIDDLQWLDAASAHVLAFALRRLEGVPIAVIACLRAGEQAGPPLDLAALMPPGACHRLALSGLSDAALEVLLETRLPEPISRHLLARVERMAGGNPFFALELGRALKTDRRWRSEPVLVPGTLSGLVEGRLSTLSAGARRALAAASILSAPTPPLIAAAIGASLDEVEEMLDEAAQGGIVAVEAGHVRFSHPIFAAVAYTIAQPRERRLLHRRLAESDVDRVERAWNLALSSRGADETRASVLEQAADLARSRGAPEIAFELAEHALALTPANEIDPYLRRTVQAAEYRWHAGELGVARTMLEGILPSLRPGGLRARVLRLLGEIRYHESSFPAAIADFEAALADAATNPGLAAAIELQLTFASVSSGDFEGIERHSTSGLRWAEQETDDGLLAEALAVRAIARFLRGHGLDEVGLRRALALEDLNRQVPVEVRPTLIAACLALYLGRIGEAVRLLIPLREQLTSSGQETDLAYVAGYLAWAETWGGRLDRAMEHATEAVRVASRIEAQSVQSLALALAALPAAAAGDETAALERARSARALAFQTGYVIAVLWANSAEASLALSLDRPQDALAVLEPLVQSVELGGVEEPIRAFFLPDAIEAMVAVGELDRASALAGLFGEASRNADRAWAEVATARCRALLLAARGDVDAALDAAQAGLARAESSELVIDRARLLLVAGVLERRLRQKRRARDLLVRALAEFESAGARLWAAKARRELERTAPERAHAGTLTPSERRIAELAAAGMTNRDIAGVLFMSPKTVDANLLRVYRKLGIHRRAELGVRVALAPGIESS